MNVTLGSAWQATERVVGLLHTERARQDARWGSQRHLPNDTWNRILVEEVGEVSKALNDEEPVENLKAELIQVTAVAVAWAEALTEEK